MRNWVLLFVAMSIAWCGVPAAGQDALWKTVSSLDFGAASGMPGWEQVPYYKGKVSILRQAQDDASKAQDDGRLVVESESGAGNEWAGNAVYYTPGFSLKGNQVRLRLGVARVNDWRDVVVAFAPLGASVYAEPAFSIHLSSGDKGGIHVRRLKGREPYDVLREDLPFRFNSATAIILLMDSKGLKLTMKQGGNSKEFSFADAFPPDSLIKPWTVFVGASQHGNPSESARLELSSILLETTDRSAPSAAEMEGNGPGEDKSVTYVSLEKVANRRFQDENTDDGSDGFTDQGANDLRNIPRGFQFFRGIPFHIDERQDFVGNAFSPGMVVLRGENTKNVPVETAPIAVGAKSAYLYFLHATSWSQADVHCADYIIRYEDGSTQTIKLQSGINIGDWWEPKDLPDAKVAWIGSNPVKDNVGFHVMQWKNPEPDKKVESIVFRSTNGPVTPMLFAITASDHEIKLGTSPRRYTSSASEICEYRQRHATSLKYGQGPAKVTVRRSLPIDPGSDVKQAKISVIRFNADTPTTISCILGGISKSLELPKGELRAVFSFQEDDVLKYLNANKTDFPVTVELTDPKGIGKYISETNPNHRWIKGGEDFKHGTYDVAGVFMVTGWLPVHKLSGYIEDQPPVVDALPVVRESASLKPGKSPNTWVGSKLCLNGPWQWQPTKDAASIPTSGWEEAVMPRDVGYEIFGRDKSATAAWFKKDIAIPAEWKGKRVAIQFQMVADFATVYINGKKAGYHAGIDPFEVDLTSNVSFGANNTIAVHAENVTKGLIPFRVRWPVGELMVGNGISPYKGKAYRMWFERGAWDQKPDEVELLLDGKDLGKRVGSIDEVVTQGNGAYFREQFWNESTLYFSVPGDLPLEEVQKRLEIGWIKAGVMKHYSFVEPSHHYRDRRGYPTGILDDSFLVVTGRSYVADVFPKPSFRKMRLDVDIEVKLDTKRPLVVSAVVRDGTKVALDLGSTKITKSGALTLGKKWAKPRLWQPVDPYLYFVQVEIRDAKTKQLVDRRFERFGFREFWVQGTDFMFNGEKFMIQADTGMGPDLPRNRHQVKWMYVDGNQQANCNLTRWHVGGLDYPSNAELADEMGMLLEVEGRFCDRPWFFDNNRNYLPDQAAIAINWVATQAKNQRNHPSIVMWSGDNEDFAVNPNAKMTPTLESIKETVMNIVPAIKKIDPTRPVDLNGENGFLYFKLWDDPRVDMLNIHYVPPRQVSDWKKTIGKPVLVGEESLGSDFGWTYGSEVRILVEQGKDPAEHYYKRENAAASFIGQMIKSWRSIDLSGIYPFGATNRYNPLFQLFDNPKLNNFASIPEQQWPAESGEGVKRWEFAVQTVQFNIWDPKRPRNRYMRTTDALKDNFAEVPKIQPRLSPELVVRVVDKAGKVVANTPVWLIPTDQPTDPIGAVSDSDGKAWFYCKAGAGKYRAMVAVRGKWVEAIVTPAPVGEWTQVKTMTAKLVDG